MRISVTTLEAFRLFEQPEWYNDEGEEVVIVSEEELTATIRGEFVPNHRIDIGWSVGQVLEYPEKYRVPGGYCVTREGRLPIELGDDVMAEPLALIDRAQTVFEAKALKTYHGCDIVAKADQMCGARLIETKASLAYFNFDKYANSYQWRFMADIFEPASITYHIFCLGENDKTHALRLKGIESFNLYPYTGVHADCAALVERFVAYVRARGLDQVLRQRQAEAVAS